MNLPKNEKRKISEATKKTLWIYGAPFSGKTTFANSFPDAIFLNTDGNIKFVDSPFVAIKDNIEIVGRITKRKPAWEILKIAIDELEKKQNDFKTVVIDVLEDCYEYCRLYMYEKLGISHESDDSFRAWDKVRIEFLSVLKRFMNMDYENVLLISHEDTSKDITRKNGEKITSIRPSIQEKLANKISGMVDVVARVVADTRTLELAPSEVVFGGGRLGIKNNKIPLKYTELFKLYNRG
jgi:phage nucleotide-binding protein